MNAIYKAQVTSSGGRAGHIKSADGLLDMDVALPKELGGKGGATNPEQLFAAGYAACFENALLHIGRQQKTKIGQTSVTATVSLGHAASGGFELSVVLEIRLPDTPKVQAEGLVEAAHKICPYSNATRGNIPVELKLVEFAG